MTNEPMNAYTNKILYRLVDNKISTALAHILAIPKSYGLISYIATWQSTKVINTPISLKCGLKEYFSLIDALRYFKHALYLSNITGQEFSRKKPERR